MWNPFKMKKDNLKQEENCDEKAQEQCNASANETDKEALNKGQATAENKTAETSESEVLDDKQEKQLSAEELKELMEKAGKAEEYWNKLLQVVADFDNFKKRSERKRQDDILSAKVAIVELFLPVLDNFEMAFMAAANLTDPAAKSLQVGVEMVLSQFRNVFSECGVDCINPKGTEFDPAEQEAMSEQETTEVAPGNVVQVLRKGYKMGTRLIRPARVVVAKAPADEKQ